MANLSPNAIILIGVGIGVVALLIGYFLGTRFGGKKSVAMREATEKHNNYKNDVREHFEQTSAIMSRMVEDYRDMYQHMAEGADKLADIHREKHITPPPEPEAITKSSAQPRESGETVHPGDATRPGDAQQASGYGEAHTDAQKPDSAAAQRDSAPDATGQSDSATRNDSTTAGDATEAPGAETPGRETQVSESETAQQEESDTDQASQDSRSKPGGS